MPTDGPGSIPLDSSRLCLSNGAPRKELPVVLCLIVEMSGVEKEDWSFGIIGWWRPVGVSPEMSLWLSTNALIGRSLCPLSYRRTVTGESVCGTATFGETLLVGVYGKLLTGKLCCAGRWRENEELDHAVCESGFFCTARSRAAEDAESWPKLLASTEPYMGGQGALQYLDNCLVEPV